MRKLIIGCGYLGRRVAALWMRDGHEVFALTRSEARADELRSAGIEPVVGDVLDRASLRGLPEAETALLAVGLDRSSGRSQREVYVDGLENVVTELRSRAGRFISISSTSVYGQTGGEWIDEDSPCAPNRPNGEVCLDAERVLWRLTAGWRGVSAIVLRLAGIYGPGRLLQRMASLRSGAILTGNPEAWLNLVHVDDAARAVLSCEARGRTGATYLVCDDRPILRREYYAALAALVGAPAPAFETPAADSLDRNDLNKRCSNRRMRSELGVVLEFPTITEGLPNAIGENGF